MFNQQFKTLAPVVEKTKRYKLSKGVKSFRDNLLSRYQEISQAFSKTKEYMYTLGIEELVLNTRHIEFLLQTRNLEEEDHVNFYLHNFMDLNQNLLRVRNQYFKIYQPTRLQRYQTVKYDLKAFETIFESVKKQSILSKNEYDYKCEKANKIQDFFRAKLTKWIDTMTEYRNKLLKESLAIQERKRKEQEKREGGKSRNSFESKTDLIASTRRSSKKFLN